MWHSARSTVLFQGFKEPSNFCPPCPLSLTLHLAGELFQVPSKASGHGRWCVSIPCLSWQQRTLPVAQLADQRFIYVREVQAAIDCCWTFCPSHARITHSDSSHKGHPVPFPKQLLWVSVQSDWGAAWVPSSDGACAEPLTFWITVGKSATALSLLSHPAGNLLGTTHCS